MESGAEVRAEQAGGVEVAISKTMMVKQSRQILTTMLGLGALLFAGFSALGWVLIGRWINPIREMVDVVVARDDVTKVKPDPELFLLAARRLAVSPPRSLVFEDSPNGTRAPRAAGMRCVAVPNSLPRSLPRPDVDLVMASLDERPLAEVLEAVAGGARDGPPTPAECSTPAAPSASTCPARCTARPSP